MPTARRPPAETPDDDLVRACLDGDDAAWEALVRRYGRLVHGLAARAGLDPEAAADVVQTVFVIVYRNLGLLDEPAALGGWIATIARREAWRASRRDARRTETEEAAVSDPAVGPDPGPPRADERLERAERAFLVERGLERIDERCRALLGILFWESPTPSYREIAERLDVPVGSLGPTRGRCLEKLRQALEELGWRAG